MDLLIDPSLHLAGAGVSCMKNFVRTSNASRGLRYESAIKFAVGDGRFPFLETFVAGRKRGREKLIQS